MGDGGVSSKNGSDDSLDTVVQQLQVMRTCYRGNDVCEVMTGSANQLKSPSADQLCKYLQVAKTDGTF